MKKEFRAHPLMLLSLIKPLLFVLVFPLIKGVLQYIIEREVTGVLTLEIAAFAIISLIGVLRWRAFKLTCGRKNVIIETGIIFKKKSVISVNKLSSVQTAQNPLDAIFRSVTYRINTEAGVIGRSDFEFKLSVKNSREVSTILYGTEKPKAVKFSVIKVAIMAATTSSAFSGMIVAVPVINRAGKLLGIALDKMLFDEINNVSSRVETYFPPMVNTITLILLLAYFVSFVYSLLKYINFRLFLEKDKLEVRSGFFVRTRTSFKKSSVNNVLIEQTPLMRLFKRYEMKVSVGGYGNSKNESAVVVPSGSRSEIKRQFSEYFPFLEPKSKSIYANRGFLSMNRFLFLPEIYFIVLAAASITLSLIFLDFTRFILFLTAVIGGIIIYYAYLTLFEYKQCKLKMGENIYAKSVKGLNTYELYCPKENVGQIRIVRTIPDLFYKTCKTTIYVRSESADRIKVRHIDYAAVKENMAECYGIRV